MKYTILALAAAAAFTLAACDDSEVVCDSAQQECSAAPQGPGGGSAEPKGNVKER